MRQRAGFVSNSSSSSFIVGVAQVTNLEVLKKQTLEDGIDFNMDFYVATLGEIVGNRRYLVRASGSKVIVESFLENAVLDATGMWKDQPILVCNIENNEGDNPFLGEDGELDYDIDINWFNAEQRVKFSYFKRTDVGLNSNTAQVKYGAGRNG